jgi:hypothetical protein
MVNADRLKHFAPTLRSVCLPNGQHVTMQCLDMDDIPVGTLIAEYHLVEGQEVYEELGGNECPSSSPAAQLINQN